MVRATPKWGKQASYWVREFCLCETVRKEIAQTLKMEMPEYFYPDLESAIGDFISWTEYKEAAPKLSHVNAALNNIEKKVDELMNNLSESTGIDGRTRQYITDMWLAGGMHGDVIHDCETALMHLGAAISSTKDSLKGTGKKGRSAGTKEEFVSTVYNIFKKYELKTSLARNGAFEKCISLILDETGYASGDDNIHALAVAAAKHHKGK